MALTWAFYVALVLFFVALGIIALLIYLLYNPRKNSFDGSRGAKKSAKRLESQLKGDKSPKKKSFMAKFLKKKK